MAMLPSSTKALLALRFIPMTFVAAAVAAVAIVAKADDRPPASTNAASTQAQSAPAPSWIENALSAAQSTADQPAEKKSLTDEDQKKLGQALGDFWGQAWQMALPWSKNMASIVWNFLGRAAVGLPGLLTKAGISFSLAPPEQDPRLNANAPVTPVLLQK